MFSSLPARANCANPSGAAGQIIFNGNYRVMQYCDGDYWIAAGPQIYNPTAVTFDGTNDYMLRGAGLNGVSDSKIVTASFWIRRAAFGSNQVVYSNTGPRFEIAFNTSDQLTLQGGSTNSSNRLVATATSPAIADSNWHHVMFSFDLSDSGKRAVYIDGSAATVTWSTYSGSAAMDFTVADHSIGARTDNSRKLNADLADFWMEIGTYVDLSNAANRAKFISGTHPVYPGADGSTPTGAAPGLFFSGAFATWPTNDGDGGGFTLTGALTASSYPLVEAGYNGSGSSSGSNVTSGLVGWWKFDESGSTTAAADSSGNGNGGTLTNTVIDGSQWTTGQNSGAVVLDGSNDYVSIANESNFDFDLSDSFSLAAWIYRTNNSTDDCVFCKIDPAAPDPFFPGFTMHFNAGDNALWMDFIKNSNDAASLKVYTNNPVSTGAWHYVVMTYNGTRHPSGVKLYIDGVNQTLTGYRDNLDNTMHMLNNTPLMVGGDTTGYSAPFGGKIDDARVYNRVLSSTEVGQLYSYSLSNGGCSNPSNAQGTIIYNTDYHVMQYCDGRTWEAMGPIPGAGGAGCNNPSGVQGKLIFNTAYNALTYCDGAKWVWIGGRPPADVTDGLIHRWEFENNGDDSIGSADSTSSTGTSYVPGKVGNALSLSGVAYEGMDVAASNMPAFDDPITISAWVNDDPSDGTGGYILDMKRQYAPPADGEQLLKLGNACSSGTCSLEVSKWGGTDILDSGSISSFQNNWHFVTYTWDGTTNRLYNDGVEVDNSTTAHDGPYAPTTVQIGIGCCGYGFKGLIDDLRIYDRALSPAEIQKVYTATGGT